jgi:hypothetical protein
MNPPERSAEVRAVDAALRVEAAAVALAGAYDDMKAAAAEIRRAAWEIGGEGAADDTAGISDSRLTDELAAFLRRLGLTEVMQRAGDAPLSDLAALWIRRLETLPDPARRIGKPRAGYVPLPGQRLVTDSREKRRTVR